MRFRNKLRLVSLQYKYRNISVLIDASPSLSNRMKELFNQVLIKLPDEEQFKMHGQVNFITRQQAIAYWNEINSQIGTSIDVIQHNADGHCGYIITEKAEHSCFFITIIVDNLESRSDNYIKGLVAHEISEMSYSWRVQQNEKENLKKLKPKARQIHINQITKQNSTVGTIDHQKHENNVDNEARRLGFSIEIDVLNS